MQCQVPATEKSKASQKSSGGPLPLCHWPEYDPNGKESRESENVDFSKSDNGGSQVMGVGNVYLFPQ